MFDSPSERKPVFVPKPQSPSAYALKIRKVGFYFALNDRLGLAEEMDRIADWIEGQDVKKSDDVLRPDGHPPKDNVDPRVTVKVQHPFVGKTLHIVSGDKTRTVVVTDFRDGMVAYRVGDQINASGRPRTVWERLDKLEVFDGNPDILVSQRP